MAAVAAVNPAVESCSICLTISSRRWMMAFKRRQLLRRLLFLLGASCVVTRERAEIAAVAAGATPGAGTQTKPGTAPPPRLEQLTALPSSPFPAHTPQRAS